MGRRRSSRSRTSRSAATGSQQDFRLIADTVPAMVFTTTPDGELEFVNRRIIEYFGLSYEELQVWQTTDAVHPDDLPNVVSEWQRGVESGQPYDFEHRLRRADGVYRWFQLRAAPLRDALGNVVRWYGLVTDIDASRRAEEEMRGVQARLSRATHLATLSELSASIAHEINQPLAAIVTNGHACRRWLSTEPPNVKRALLSADRIIHDGNSSAEIIRRIRLLFKLSPLVKDLLNMNEVVAEVCSLMDDELRSRSVSLKISLQSDLPRTLADRVQIQQVIANFARNGIEAMDSLGERRKELSISTRSSDGEIAVHVTDCGGGIDDPQRIFEPFYTTNPTGMGMGLAICRTIVEAHGGRLWTSNNAPQGATFAFALRIATSEPG